MPLVHKDKNDKTAAPHSTKMLVVLPIYNEAEVITNTISVLASILPTLDVQFEIICVDDGSVDCTPSQLKLLRRGY